MAIGWRGTGRGRENGGGEGGDAGLCPAPRPGISSLGTLAMGMRKRKRRAHAPFPHDFLANVEGLYKRGECFHGFLHRQNQTNKPHLPTCPPNSPPYYYDCYLLRIYQKSGGFPKEPFSDVLFHSTLEVSFNRAISGVLKRRNRTGKGPDAPRPRQIYCRKSPCLESPAILLCSGNHPARGRSLSCT